MISDKDDASNDNTPQVPHIRHAYQNSGQPRDTSSRYTFEELRTASGRREQRRTRRPEIRILLQQHIF
ncbi:hypothetical protein Tco_0664445 [Tanacetum coccineum]